LIIKFEFVFFLKILKQELYETQLQLRTKTAFIYELQNDVEQLQIVEDENIKLKSEITTKESDLRQWTVKVIHLNYITICYNLIDNYLYIFLF